MKTDSMGKGERRKRDFLATASALFASKGYTATTIQDILDQLGCTKGSFYHHFSSKLDLLLGLAAEQAGLAYREYMRTALHSGGTDSLNALLRAASLLDQRHLTLHQAQAQLTDAYEGMALQAAMYQAVYTAFFPAFASLMHSLRREDLASFVSEDELQLALRGFLTACPLLLGTDSPGLLRALRLQTERALGLRAHSLRILGQEELLSLREGLRR